MTSAPLTVVNSTITLGGTSQVLQAARKRTSVEIQNNSAGDLWINFGAPAAIGTGIRIATNLTWRSDPAQVAPDNSINIIGASTAQAFAYIIV